MMMMMMMMMKARRLSRSSFSLWMNHFKSWLIDITTITTTRTLLPISIIPHFSVAAIGSSGRLNPRSFATFRRAFAASLGPHAESTPWNKSSTAAPGSCFSFFAVVDVLLFFAFLPFAFVEEETRVLESPSSSTSSTFATFRFFCRFFFFFSPLV